MTEQVQCADCGGIGTLFFLCKPGKIPCHWCKGTGKMDQRPEAWRFAGIRMRAARQAAGRTMGDEARRRGISVVEVSDMERGRREPKQ